MPVMRPCPGCGQAFEPTETVWVSADDGAPVVSSEACPWCERVSAVTADELFALRDEAVEGSAP